MPRASRVCPTAGCPNITTSGRCADCRHRAEQQRGSARQRGYDHRHEALFRDQVLTRDPLCVCTASGHGHTGQCLAPSAHADHYPRERSELVRLGLNPNDPDHGRGLCARCHSHETSTRTPGGWNRR